MTTQLDLADHPTRDDLRVFLERVLRVGQPEVRLVTRGSALSVFGCTQAPAGITDPVPVVLVSRGFLLGEDAPASIDLTVSARSLLDRLARMGVVGLTLELPENLANAAWAGVLPPRSGWQAQGAIDAASLRAVAEQGMARVAAALPDSPGESVVRTVRTQVWGAEVAPGVPAAAAFALEALGFLRGEEPLRLASTLTWTSLVNERGQVFVRRLLG